MRWRFLLLLWLAIGVRGQEAPAPADASLANILNFETDQPGPRPTGWGGGPKNTIFVDSKIVHSGKWAVRIERTEDSVNKFTTVTRSAPLAYAGKTIELRGFLRTENVSEGFGLWIRDEGEEKSVFATTQKPDLKGTTEWTEYTAYIPLNPTARTLVFGIILAGSGRVWADDLQLLIDGKPIWEALKVEREQTVLDRDHEFDGGSRVSVDSLSSTQVENLATLGRVWGFLKYYHPRVVAGEFHWDYELFRVLPKVLAATDRNAASEILVAWVDGLGEVKPAAAPAREPADALLRPDTDWMKDEAVLGAALTQRLVRIYDNRSLPAEQFYVGFAPGARNPKFTNELAYQRLKLPDTGYQLLALYRYWNMIRYWYPYREVIGENWDGLLKEYVPRVALATDADAYKISMLTLIARVNDTHANLWSSFEMLPPRGNDQLPVVVRFINGEAVVAGVVPLADVPATLLQPGDVIEEINGVPVAKLVEQWRPYYAASNQPTRLREIARKLTNGKAGEVQLTVRRDGKNLTLSDARMSSQSVVQKIASTRDLPGDAFRLLSNDVAYLKLSTLKAVDVLDCLARAAGTKGLIIDIRNYPGDFPVLYALGSHLVEQPTQFYCAARADPTTPGTYAFSPPYGHVPKSPYYRGRVVILVDETSQSLAEFMAMGFRVAPGALVVGSTTAGADGDVSYFSLPGGLRTGFSGIGIFYPDRRPTQRIGIVADVEAKPTIEGIKEGRDEVLEVGLRQILGPNVSAEEIRKIVPIPNGISGVIPGK